MEAASVEQAAFPHELIVGTMLGLVPVYEGQLTKGRQREKAFETIDAYLERKRHDAGSNEVLAFDDGHAASFEEDFTSKKSR